MNQEFQKPIFIVGAARSGTTMMSRMLSINTLITISPETHYFEDLRTRLSSPTEKITSDSERELVEDYFLPLFSTPYGHELENDSWKDFRETLRSDAESLGGSADNYFESFLRLNNTSGNECVLGEKTPRHVFSIDQIVEKYPDCRIVGIVRDPRSVTASYKKWHLKASQDESPENKSENNRVKNSYHPIVISLLWLGAVNALKRATEKHSDKTIYQIKYEDIVSSPKLQTEKLCDWLGIEYQPEMLDVSIVNSTYLPFEQDHGVTTGSLERWRENLDSEEIYLVQKITKKAMSSFDYTPKVVRPKSRSILFSLLQLPRTVLTALLLNKHRIGSLFSFIVQRIRLISVAR